MNDKNRNDIFQAFSSLDSNDRKKQFVIANITKRRKERSTKTKEQKKI